MRCPHCGFVTFDHLVICKGCGGPLRPALGVARSGQLPPLAAKGVAATSPDADSTAASGATAGFARAATEAEPLDQGRFTLPPDLSDNSSAREIERGESRSAARGVPAGLWRRLVAATVDGVLIGVLSLLAMILAALAAIGGQVMAQGMGDTAPLVGSVGAFGAGLAVSLAYSILCWVHGGQTPGKIFARIQVVGTDGGPIGYGQALARWIGYLVALAPFGLGFFLIPLHPMRRGVHDLLAGTRVVTVPAQEEMG